ncbi:MAG: LysR family transcriptional regulator [Verrucomicrobia bacterium]|nr:LysR family transcriptional regulator [Verrucomicrobiota bacterium]
MISAELFRTFLTIYREGSVSSAARSRHLTQSAVSQQLSSLEEMIGAPLFQRTVRGMLPTSRGRSLYDQVFESIDKLDQVSRGILKNADPKTPNRSETPLRIGTSPDYFDIFALPRLKAHDFSCIVTFGEPRELHTLLQSGMLDAVISVAKPSVRALQYRILAEKCYVLIGPPGMKPKKPLRNLNNLANWLKTQHWVGYSVELPNTRRFWQQVLGLRLEGQLRFVVPDLRTVVHAVEQGFGVTIVPDFIGNPAITQKRVCEIWPIKDLIPSDHWTLTFRELDADRPAIADLVKALTLTSNQ